MKTSNLLIAAAVLGAGYLYKKRKDDTAPVAVVVPTETPTGGVAENTGVVPPGYTALADGTVVQTVSASFTPKPKTIGQKIVILDKKDVGKVHLGAYNSYSRSAVRYAPTHFATTSPFA